MDFFKRCYCVDLGLFDSTAGWMSVNHVLNDGVWTKVPSHVFKIRFFQSSGIFVFALSIEIITKRIYSFKTLS